MCSRSCIHIISNPKLFISQNLSSSTMVRGLSKAVANNRAMTKLKPSLPANNTNQSSDDTLDYVGFWQQKALLHFTNSAYKGTFLISMNFVQYWSAHFLFIQTLAMFWFVIFQSSNLLVPRSSSFRVSWRLMPRRYSTWDMRACASTTTALPWIIANYLTVLTAVELPHDFSCMTCRL